MSNVGGLLRRSRRAHPADRGSRLLRKLRSLGRVRPNDVALLGQVPCLMAERVVARVAWAASAAALTASALRCGSEVWPDFLGVLDPLSRVAAVLGDHLALDQLGVVAGQDGQVAHGLRSNLGGRRSA